jgi:hypothetical protein
MMRAAKDTIFYKEFYISDILNSGLSWVLYLIYSIPPIYLVFYNKAVQTEYSILDRRTAVTPDSFEHELFALPTYFNSLSVLEKSVIGLSLSFLIINIFITIITLFLNRYPEILFTLDMVEEKEFA